MLSLDSFNANQAPWRVGLQPSREKNKAVEGRGSKEGPCHAMPDQSIHPSTLAGFTHLRMAQQFNLGIIDSWLLHACIVLPAAVARSVTRARHCTRSLSSCRQATADCRFLIAEHCLAPGHGLPQECGGLSYRHGPPLSIQLWRQGRY